MADDVDNWYLAVGDDIEIADLVMELQEKNFMRFVIINLALLRLLK